MIRISIFRIPIFSLLCLISFFIIEPTSYLLIILSAVLCHELGHLILMRCFSVDIASVTLLPLGIDIRPGTRLISYRRQAMISLGGAAVNILLFLIFRLNSPFLAYTNLLYAVFNLLPIKGLDGGEALFSLLSCIADEELCDRILKLTSIIFCILLWLAGIYILFILNGNISIFALSVFLCFSIFFNHSN